MYQAVIDEPGSHDIDGPGPTRLSSGQCKNDEVVPDAWDANQLDAAAGQKMTAMCLIQATWPTTHAVICSISQTQAVHACVMQAPASI